MMLNDYNAFIFSVADWPWRWRITVLQNVFNSLPNDIPSLPRRHESGRYVTDCHTTLPSALTVSPHQTCYHATLPSALTVSPHHTCSLTTLPSVLTVSPHLHITHAFLPLSHLCWLCLHISTSHMLSRHSPICPDCVSTSHTLSHHSPIWADCVSTSPHHAHSLSPHHTCSLATFPSALTVSPHQTCSVSKSHMLSNTNLNCCCPEAFLLAAVIWFAICWFRSRFRCNLSCNSEIRLSMLLISSWRCDSASLCWQRRAFCCSFSLLRYCNYIQQHDLTGFLTIL